MSSANGYSDWQAGQNGQRGLFIAPVTAHEPRQGNTSIQERIKSGMTASTSRGGQLFETAKILGAGGIAGAFSKSCTAPLARLTILYQVQALKQVAGKSGQLGLAKAFGHIIRTEGPLALWKGNGVTVIHRLPYSAINFWAYERITEVWRKYVPKEKSSPSIDFSRRLIAGGLAGSLACAVAYPLDLVRTRLSVQVRTDYYQGIGRTLRTIVRDEGVPGLYRGLGATLLQVAPALAINYAAYESLRAYYMARSPERSAPSMAQSLACGSMAGLISSTLTFPLDLVRRRLQLEGQRGAQLKYHSYASVFKSIYHSQGVRGFYQGIWPEYYKVIPGVAIAFCVYECMKSVVGVTTNKDGR